MTATYRVTIKPEKSGAQVLTIAQPSLRITFSKGGGGAALPTEKTFGAAKVYGSLVSGYASNGLPNADTQAAIDYALAQGYPAWSIIWMYQGEAVAGSVSSTATVPAFSAWATFTPPSVTASAVGEAVSASATIPALTALASFTAPTVTSGFGVDATVAVPQLSAVASLYAPTVTGGAGVTATVTVPQLSAVSTFAAPTVYATRNAAAAVPQFAASATFAAPSVTVTPAGATAASVTVPSFGAVATFAAPSVAAQGAATASVPSFSAMASLSAPSVTGVVQTLATVTVPQFAATSTFASPAVSAQKAATAAIPSLSATSTLTNPYVAATRGATASVPSFGATAAFTAPTAAGVQQAAAVSATATPPSFTATATLTTPSVAGTTVTASLPVQVTGVSASNSPAQITVTWSAVSGATSYNLYYNTVSNLTGATKISGVTGTSTSQTINGPLTANTGYYVWVSAQNAAGEGALSAWYGPTVASAAVVVPVTLSFESATITDSSGATWEKVIPTAVDQGAVGVITSGVSGISGADGNCLSIKQSVYDDGSDLYNLDTFIRRTMNVGAGTISIRVKRTNPSMWGYVKVDGTSYSLGLTTVGSFIDKTVTIPAAKTNVVVEIGFTGGAAVTDNYIDTVSIPQ